MEEFQITIPLGGGEGDPIVSGMINDDHHLKTKIS